MEFLRDVGFYWIYVYRRRSNTGERQHVIGGDLFRIAEDLIAESNIDTEGLTVQLAG